MADASKVRFGLSNVHYAPITFNQGVATYGTPVKIPGAVSISLSVEGSEPNTFWADNIAYYIQAGANGGYSGTITMAIIPDTFKVAVLGEVVDDNGMQVELANADTHNFALMYEVNGDADKKRYCFFNCTASRVANGANTTSDSTDPDTQELEFSAIGTDFTFEGATKSIVRGSADSNANAYSTWFSAVPTPTKAASGSTGDTN